MKKLTNACLFIALIIASGSCSKNESDPAILQVSQTGDAHIGQPITFTLPSVSAGTNVTWTATTSKATISALGNTATISFHAAGNYVVNGTSGATSASSNITVDTINYFPLNGSTTVPFGTSEQLKITAKRNDSSVTASGLTFTMETASSYSCKNSLLSFTASNGSGGTASYIITVIGIGIPLAGCTVGSSKASGSASTKVPLPVGSTTLAVLFNGTTYTGTIVKTGNAYSISWNYTSGVTISPLSL
jgi:hypothetical protein